jgi:hypothetical protein
LIGLLAPKKPTMISESWLRELNRPQDSGPSTEKVLDSPAKSRTFSDFPEDQGGPKTAQKTQ